VFVNLVLALTKIAGGLFGRSNALIADGIESSLDVLSSVMMWGAIKYAERPPDSDHPYGHGKMESLATRTNKSLNHHSVLDDLPSCGDEQIACFRTENGNFVF